LTNLFFFKVNQIITPTQRWY